MDSDVFLNKTFRYKIYDASSGSDSSLYLCVNLFGVGFSEQFVLFREGYTGFELEALQSLY